jgi:hypothetical protein
VIRNLSHILTRWTGKHWIADNTENGDTVFLFVELSEDPAAVTGSHTAVPGSIADKAT